MSEPLDITVLIATRNEAANIGICLKHLEPVRRVLVIDSNSTDETVLIARQHGAEVVSFEWNGQYPRKRQWALDQLGVTTAWVMLLDADESTPAGLWAEVRAVVANPDAETAYLAKKEFHFMGRRMRFGGFSHSSVFLFKTGCARFENLLPDAGENLDMEVHERLIVKGSVDVLHTPLIHRDYKGLDAYIARHRAYAAWEAELRFRCLTTGRYGEDAIQPRWNGNIQERRRFLKQLAMRLPGEANAWFLYHYLLRGAFLEGKAGLKAALIRRAYIKDVRTRIREKMKRAASLTA